jgi:endonuclease/exonuclease/phosphatase family metal-dependent hydrolase
MKPLLSMLLVLMIAPWLPAQQITVATYNIEHFAGHFLARRIATTRPSVAKNPEAQDLMESERRHEDEDNWETAEVILDPRFSPDILAIQEGCSQADLEYFNHRWLRDSYSTVIVFDSNTDREQTIGMMIRPGFKVVDRKDQYYREPDPVPNERGNRLFARGPAFLLVEAPSGYRFWIGTNHQKSKADNSVEVTQWRNREALRTHQIIKEIEKSGPSDVIFLGDMNDEAGIQMYELQGGGDVISNLVGPVTDGIFLATSKLAEAGKISYFGYSRTDHRSLIDHIFVTSSFKDQIEDVQVFQNGFTAVSSDHCPVMMRFLADN